MKQRFSSLDVKVIAHELSATVTSLRISNIYDLSSRIFLFKLAKPDSREQLLVDAGFRCHLTEYSRTTATHPSHFVSKLRKYLRSRRITGVSQVGTDRILHFEFSGRYHLFLEFYAGGNIVLTDHEYNILSLFRVVSEATGAEELRVGLKYSLSDKQNYDGIPPLSMQRVKDSLHKAKEKEQTSQGAAASKKSKNKQVNVSRQALSLGFPEFPPLLLDHAFEVVGYDPTLRLDQVLEDSTLQEKLMLVLQEAENVNNRLSCTDGPTGYIIAKTDTPPKPKSVTFEDMPGRHGDVLYEDFHPFRPQQFKEKPGVSIIEFQGYNKTVDEFFSSAESQKLESRLTEKEENAKRKLDSARQDHEKRIGALRETQELHIRKAQAIEANLYRVEEAITAVNGLIAQGMDWVEIARLIEMEQKKQNPVAKTVKLPLKLYANTVTLLLAESSFEDDEDETYESGGEDDDDETDSEAGKAESAQHQLIPIDIDLGLSPWANARQYYNQKKTVAAKQEKTLQSSTKALKSTEKKVTADLKRGLKQEKQVLRPARKPFWFEKFTFFISSDGYLVLGGRDASQNDILYRQYLKKGDVFVHADLDGAIPIIIKNKIGAPDSPIPPGTLSQAGTLSVATSVAWDSKAVIAAWWVRAEQVSKIAPTGDFMSPGNFFVRGNKNFLPPAQLVLGFAVLFHISEESLSNHTKHRVQDGGSEIEQTMDQMGRPDVVPLRDQDNFEEQEDVPNNDEESGIGSEDALGDTEEPTNPLQTTDDDDQIQGAGGIPRSINDEHVEEEEHNESEEEDNESLDESAIEQTTNQGQSGSKEGREKASASTPSSSTPSESKKLSIAQSRGKKGKKKKLKTKYAHQDDEDRELALRLLGSGAKANKAAEAAKAKAAREAEAEAQKERRRAQHNRAMEAERQRQLEFAEQEGEGQEGPSSRSQELTESEISDLACISCLVGTPAPGDEILAAIPVCAPWTALAQCKFRTKLQPGTMKKGKAVKDMLGRWIADATAATSRSRRKLESTSEEGSTEVAGDENDAPGGKSRNIELRELELIKGWRDVEVINTVPVGKVRIVSSGGGGGGGGKGKGDGKGKGNSNNSKKPAGKGGKGGKKKR